MAEELVTLIRAGKEPLRLASHEEQEHYAAIATSGNIPEGIAIMQLERALDQWHSLPILPLLKERADALAHDHQRVREASRMDAGSVQVACCTPPDLLSILACQPII